MIDWNVVSMDQLLETYAVSNTASFLYGRFRRDNGIIDLSKKYNVQELIAELRRVLQIDKLTAEGVVKAYACLIALSFSDINLVNEALKNIDLKRLRWGYQIIALMEAVSVRSNFLYVPYKPTIVLETDTSSVTSSTSITKITIPTR